MQHMHVSLEVDQIDELAGFLPHHRHVLVLTGAGSPLAASAGTGEIAILGY
jgi:hypothetical protein